VHEPLSTRRRRTHRVLITRVKPCRRENGVLLSALRSHPTPMCTCKASASLPAWSCCSNRLTRGRMRQCMRRSSMPCSTHPCACAGSCQGQLDAHAHACPYMCTNRPTAEVRCCMEAVHGVGACHAARTRHAHAPDRGVPCSAHPMLHAPHALLCYWLTAACPLPAACACRQPRHHTRCLNSPAGT
jgi:hypothetical protein